MALKDIYPVNNVEKGFKYYKRMLTEKCFGMFEYENLPDSLPEEQIEKNLIKNGFAAIFNHPIYGIVTAPASLFGEDLYYLPTKCTYNQVKLGSKTLTIGVNCAIIYNSQIDLYEPRRGLSELIDRYARMLADVDSSIVNCIVNTRSQKWGYAKSPNAAEALKKAINALYAGDPAIINHNSILEMVKTLDWNDNTNGAMMLDKLFTSKTKALADFLQEIGVKTAFEKNERLITSEVSANDQLLTINVDDMFKCRKKGLKVVNAIFGTDIKVKHNSAYYVKTGGGNNDS